MTTKGKSPIGRASYVHVFQPQVDKKDPNKKTYSITLLFPKSTDLSVLKAAYSAAVAERWPNKKPSGIRSPFRDGDEVDGEGTRKRGPEYANMTYVTFRTKAGDRKVGVVDAALEEVTQSDGKLYSGCYVKVSFSAYAYENDGNCGVSFGLNNVQVIKDGERFDGRVDATEDFDAVEDASANNKAMF